jgi:hypothetical protein
MFIDTIPNRKSPPAVLLRESYREGGKVKKRTLANLSQLPQALLDGIAALLAGGKVAPADASAAEPGFEIVRSLAHGHVAAVRGMIRKLGLDRTLQGRSQVERRVRDIIEAMLVQRIIAAGSKLALPARASARDGDVEPRPLGRPRRCGGARGVRGARLAGGAAAADRGGICKEASRRRHARALRRVVELHGGPLLCARQARLQPRPPPRPAADRVRPVVRTRRHAGGGRGVRGQHRRPRYDPRSD